MCNHIADFSKMMNPTILLAFLFASSCQAASLRSDIPFVHVKLATSGPFATPEDGQHFSSGQVVGQFKLGTIFPLNCTFDIVRNRDKWTLAGVEFYHNRKSIGKLAKHRYHSELTWKSSSDQNWNLNVYPDSQTLSSSTAKTSNFPIWIQPLTSNGNKLHGDYSCLVWLQSKSKDEYAEEYDKVKFVSNTLTLGREESLQKAIDDDRIHLSNWPFWPL